MGIFFSKGGTNYSLTRLGPDKHRFAMQNDRSQGASQELTENETAEMINKLVLAYEAEPDTVDTSRADALLAALRDYAELSGKNIESIDKECSSVKPALTREEWLAAQLGPEDLEEVIAGKLSVAEALANNEPGGEEIEEDEEDEEDDGDEHEVEA
jgi:hypothetical protein